MLPDLVVDEREEVGALLVAEAETDVLIVGHTHSPMVLEAPDLSGVIVSFGVLLRPLAGGGHSA